MVEGFILVAVVAESVDVFLEAGFVLAGWK
jgi:hypothetical protein